MPPSIMEEEVLLNVGGTKFSTSKSTLMAYPDSVLARMFSSSASIYLHKLYYKINLHSFIIHSLLFFVYFLYIFCIFLNLFYFNNFEEMSKKKDGEYFFDRDPEIFHEILKFYSTSRIVVPKGTPLARVKDELEYFGIDVEEEGIKNKLCKQ